MATTYDRRRPRIPEDLGQRIDATRGQVPFDAFVRRAVEAALSGSPNGASPSPERVPEPSPAPSGAREAVPPRASGPSVERVMEAKAKVSGAEDGLPGPTFGLSVDQAHAWFRAPSEKVSGGYVAWRSRKERWMRERGR